MAYLKHFQRFDVVSDHSDHHYRLHNNGGFIASGSSVHKKIMSEWKILQKHLPDSIYVRAYETRIDLLRAVIVGPAGTPYHDALFFFDIAFPPDYPTHPPQVHYRSFGLRVNPNLYANGYVCLSLLNTWVGSKDEKWVPSKSTILQVLVSIQGLVLNENPYYNEPGAGVLGSKSSSRAYSESAFVLTCKTTLFLHRRPPLYFEAFVVDHYRERAAVILRACAAYANGRAAVGHYTGQDGGVSVAKVGKKFRKSMEVLYPKLYVAFAVKGADLGGLAAELKVEEAEKAEESGGVVKWALGKWIGLFGCGSEKAYDEKSNADKSLTTKKNGGGLKS